MKSSFLHSLGKMVHVFLNKNLKLLNNTFSKLAFSKRTGELNLEIIILLQNMLIHFPLFINI